VCDWLDACASEPEFVIEYSPDPQTAPQTVRFCHLCARGAGWVWNKANNEKAE